MAKNTILINDFRAGELTPDMDARVDLKDYYRGCRILENAMPIIEGGVARVPGTYYVRPVKTDEGWCLRVTKSGTGTGIVTSDLVPGINCGSDCYVFFVDGITVVLTATPDAGMSFSAWSGDGTGLVTRSVLMNGNKVVNAEFGLLVPLALDFNPQDICSDGTYFYICGFKYYSSPANFVSKVVKIRISDFVEVDSVEYDEAVSGTLVELYSGIRYSNGFIYLSGQGISSSKQRVILHCRPVSDLSTLTWAYNYAVAGQNCYFLESEVDGDYVYGTGFYGTTSIRIKVDKLTGAEIWKFFDASHGPGGMNQDGNYLYVYEDYSGNNAIEKVLKSNGNSTTYTYDPTTILGHSFRGCLDGTNIFVCGYSPLYQAITMKIKMSDMSWVWSYRTNREPANLEYSLKCVQDGANIYTIGIVNTKDAPYAWDAILEKLDMNGNLVLSKTITGYINYAILESGDYLYLGIYDYTTNSTYWVLERRLKSTLEIG